MRFSFTAFLTLLAFSLSAQNDLPKGLSPQEFTFLESGLYSFPEDIAGIPAPPPYPVRSMAEWEELQALVITWTSFKPILAQIVEHAKEECQVIVVCSDSLDTQFELLNNYGLPDLNNVSFLQAPYNTIWIRDYGPNCVYANGVDSLYLIDWIYNRPRPKDDLIPEEVGEFMNLPVYSTTAAPTDFVHTGGNYLSDGMGTAFSSELILEENEPGNPYGVTPKDEAAIDQIMETFMGVDRYIKMPILPYDGIHHIDMHWFLLDEETFIVGEYPEGVSDGPQIEANLQYVLANYMSPYGTPYKVIRIQMPPGNSGAYPWTGGPYRTYTNALFVNKTLLVPTYSPQYDEANLQIYRDALPGYKVVGINCNSIIGSLGALHCITKPVGVDDPLLIQHQPLEDATDYAGDFEVEATIRHRSGISEAILYYTTDTAQGYASAAMTLANPAEHTWTGYIPSQSSETEVFYYIEGHSNSGKTLARPLSAPAGFWNFDVSFTNTATAEADPGYRTQLDPIFPNPASAITCIPVQSSRSVEAQIDLIDMLGRTVHTVFSGDLAKGESNYFIHANDFEAGAYLVRLQTEHQQQIRKLVIR